jgi:hypothetical protein
MYPAEYGTIIFSVLIGFHIGSLCAEKTESDGMTARDWMVYLGVVRDHSQVDIPSLKGNTTPPTLHTASLKETLDQRDAYLMAQINASLVAQFNQRDASLVVQATVPITSTSNVTDATSPTPYVVSDMTSDSTSEPISHAHDLPGADLVMM